MTEPDSVAEQLKKLGGELATVAGDQVARVEKLKEIEELLGNLKIKDFPELADSPIIQQFSAMFAQGLKPGEVRNRGTLAEATQDWTIEDFRRMPHVTFIPVVTIDITVNGVGPYRLVQGEECSVPETIYSHYREHLYRTKQADIHAKWLMGLSDQLPDANWLTSEGARVAATSRQGASIGRRSGSMGVGWFPGADEGEAAGGQG